ncbi:MAG: MarR family transcriptional regulator [Bacteroidetes bacterium]|nr:MarR family transcriptional regulator [Bacteroidota bacterium]
MNIDNTIRSIHKLGITTKTVVNLMYTTRIIEEAIAGVLQAYDITIQQYNVLRILRGQKGKPANLCTIQERMIDRSSNTTRLVDKLIKKEWVERRVCERNRRKVEIFITNNGLDVLQELDPVIDDNNKKIVSNLSFEQLEGLNGLLDLLRE